MRRAVVALGALAFALAAAPARAGEIEALCPHAIASACTRVADDHRAATGTAVRLSLGTAGALRDRAATGPAADVV
ncbi:MAG: hypothetical protein HY216_12635 [Candidatus Rokubacteria bacterium]|nr:hypothetical protein [Candidatus Rokubacteria bacterium]